MYTHTHHIFRLKGASESGVFTGYASEYSVDSHQERVEPGAFKNCLDQMIQTGYMPKMLWQHEPQTPIGRWEKIVEDEHGLYVQGRLFLDLPKAREAYILMKECVVDGLSIGFEIVKSKRSENQRILQEIRLHEISLVTFPANTKARVHHVKNQEDSVLDLMDCINQLKKALRE